VSELIELTGRVFGVIADDVRGTQHRPATPLPRSIEVETPAEHARQRFDLGLCGGGHRCRGAADLVTISDVQQRRRSSERERRRGIGKGSLTTIARRVRAVHWARATSAASASGSEPAHSMKPYLRIRT